MPRLATPTRSLPAACATLLLVLPMLAGASPACTAAGAPPGATGMPSGAAASHAGGPTAVPDASTASIQAYVRQRHARVLTLAGYSGAGYQDSAAMLDQVGRVLDAHDARKTLVNIGATAQGIGAAYVLAKQRGFTTIGIVSSLARDEGVALSPCVDVVFYVPDATWGGRLPGGKRLSPTSAALVAVSHEIVAIGGGDIARDELLAARRRGKRVQFIPADMHHQTALDKALAKGQPAPTDFRGALDAAWAGPR